MRKGWIAVLIMVTGLSSMAARADVLVLVHGYLSGAQSWDASGVTGVLQQHDWQRAGIYVAGPAGIQQLPAAGIQTANKFYAVQVYQLNEILNSISQTHKDESVILVGHSAGGVVARATVVRGHHDNVKALITIASPHLGTSRAEQALDATDIPFPISMITDFFAGETYHNKSLGTQWRENAHGKK